MANRLDAQPNEYFDLKTWTRGTKLTDSTIKADDAMTQGVYFQMPYATPTERISGGIYLLDKQELNELIQENKGLRQDISALIEKVSELIAFIGENYENKAENMIVLREITREQAKKEIENLFQASGSLYYSDIAENLRLDLELVVDLCSELEKEGKIKLK